MNLQHGHSVLRHAQAMPQLSAVLILVCGLFLIADTVHAQEGGTESIGQAQTIVRDVTAEEEGEQEEERFLIVRDPVFQHEFVQTLDVSATKLQFKDETEMTLGPNSKVLLDEFVYNPNISNNKMVLNIAKGVARFVSGKMQKSQYALKTPTATIGIRGTVLTMTVNEGKTDLFVQSGLAFVRSTGTGGEVEVPAGFRTSVPFGEDPSDPEPAPNGLDGTDVVEMDALIEIAGDDADDDGQSGDGSGDGQDGEDDENEEEELLYDSLEPSESLRGGYGCDC